MQLWEADLEFGRQIRNENCGPELSPADPVVGLMNLAVRVSNGLPPPELSSWRNLRTCRSTVGFFEGSILVVMIFLRF